MSRILVDIDGVVADLMGTFQKWMAERVGFTFELSKITRHAMELSPELDSFKAELAEGGRPDLQTLFFEFMDVGAYDNVKPIPGAVEYVNRLCDDGHDVLFATAIGKFYRTYPSKAEWVKKYFPKCKMISVPSECKHYLTADFAIDDRADIILNYWNSGNVAGPILLIQSWSFSNDEEKNAFAGQYIVEKNNGGENQDSLEDNYVRRWKNIYTMISGCSIEPEYNAFSR